MSQCLGPIHFHFSKLSIEIKNISALPNAYLTVLIQVDFDKCTFFKLTQHSLAKQHLIYYSSNNVGICDNLMFVYYLISVSRPQSIFTNWTFNDIE